MQNVLLFDNSTIAASAARRSRLATKLRPSEYYSRIGWRPRTFSEMSSMPLVELVIPQCVFRYRFRFVSPTNTSCNDARAPRRRTDKIEEYQTAALDLFCWGEGSDRGVVFEKINLDLDVPRDATLRLCIEKAEREDAEKWIPIFDGELTYRFVPRWHWIDYFVECRTDEIETRIEFTEKSAAQKSRGCGDTVHVGNFSCEVKNVSLLAMDLDSPLFSRPAMRREEANPLVLTSATLHFRRNNRANAHQTLDLSDVGDGKKSVISESGTLQIVVRKWLVKKDKNAIVVVTLKRRAYSLCASAPWFWERRRRDTQRETTLHYYEWTVKLCAEPHGDGTVELSEVSIEPASTTFWMGAEGDPLRDGAAMRRVRASTL